MTLSPKDESGRSSSTPPLAPPPCDATSEEATICFAPPDSGARFSPCRNYRYLLWRRWAYGPMTMFIGLNPSTADETENDMTVTKCIGFSKRLGAGGVIVANLYGYRSTDPAALVDHADPEGRDNQMWLVAGARQSSTIIAAWGGHELARTMGLEICELLNRDIHCLGKTGSGFPRHPSRLGYAASLEIFYTPLGHKLGTI